MSLLVAPGLALLLVLIGRSVHQGIADLPDEPALSFAIGLLLLHVGMVGTSLLGIGWSALAPVLPAGLALIPLLARRRLLAPRSLTRSLGFGDLLAAAAIGAFAVTALAGWSTTSDFIYHWGLKARRFALTDGVDWAFLSQPDNWRIHVDYPTLWNEVLALTMRLQQSLEEGPLLLWGPTLLALTVVAGRVALTAAGARGARFQALVALLGASLAGFAIRQQMAGAADWFVVLGSLIAAPALLASAPDRSNDLRLGAGAALAAAAKVEGVVVAALLVVVYLAGDVRRPWNDRLRGWSLAAVPAAFSTLAWLLLNHHFALRGMTTFGAPELARGPAILRTSLFVASLGSWQGMPLVLLGLPWILLSRRSRRLGWVLVAQLAFYALVYFAAKTDPTYYILSTLPRLLVNLIPLALIGLVAFLSERLEARTTAIRHEP
ncbi:MAG: hypothetical protein IPJ17_20070 [Holophagales bacterium]|nr:MAG: hypothetical protein IPJ17_20070 [Holophagales bacterium]